MADIKSEELIELEQPTIDPDFLASAQKRIADKLERNLNTPPDRAMQIAEGVSKLYTDPAEIAKVYGKDVALQSSPIIDAIGSFGKGFAEARAKAKKENAITPQEYSLLQTLQKQEAQATPKPRTPQQTSQGESNLRKEVNKFPIIAQRDNYFSKYKQMKSAADEQAKRISSGEPPVSFLDFQLVYQLNKLFDENSVVRESEFANTAKARAVIDEGQALAQKLADGAILTPEQRKNIVITINGIMKEVDSQAQPIIKQYGDIAKREGYNVDNVILLRQKFEPIADFVEKGGTAKQEVKQSVDDAEAKALKDKIIKQRELRGKK